MIKPSQFITVLILETEIGKNIFQRLALTLIQAYSGRSHIYHILISTHSNTHKVGQQVLVNCSKYICRLSLK